MCQKVKTALKKKGRCTNKNVSIVIYLEAQILFLPLYCTYILHKYFSYLYCQWFEM